MQITKHTIRGFGGNGTVEVVLNRQTAIKAQCTECMGYESDPKECTSKLCSLWPWRGKTLVSCGRQKPKSKKKDKKVQN
jgi:hypothetical protein